MNNKSIKNNPVFAVHCAAINAEGRAITAFRVGMQVGERGEDLPCPYDNPKSAGCYLAGVKFGRQCRKEQQAHAKATGAAS